MLGLIDKDVARTDRTELFYAGDDNPNLAKLRRMLAIYSLLHRPDLPYTQGMNEFASQMLYVQDGREADAFWCFERLMRFQGAPHACGRYLCAANSLCASNVQASTSREQSSKKQ